MNAAPSREHWKLDVSLAVKLKLAFWDSPFDGAALIVVCGAVVSGGSTTVQLWVAGVWSALAA